MWTSPVATQRTPSRSARSYSQRLRARSDRQNGRCSSIRKRSRPKAPTSRRPSASAAAASAARGLRPAAPEVPRQRPVASAAREADEPLGPLLERAQRQGGGGRLATRHRARFPVGLGDQPAEIPPPLPALDQQREMERLVGLLAGQPLVGTRDEVPVGACTTCRPAGARTRRQRSRRRGCRRSGYGHFGADDRADPEGPAGLGELHRPPDPVVVGQREGPWPSSAAGLRQLLRRRRPVEEGVGGVAVQLDVITPATPARGRHPADWQVHARWRNQRPRPALPDDRSPQLPSGLAEDHHVAAVGEHELEVAAAKRPRRPPAILDQPLLPHRVHRDRVDRARRPVRIPSRTSTGCGQ